MRDEAQSCQVWFCTNVEEIVNKKEKNTNVNVYEDILM